MKQTPIAVQSSLPFDIALKIASSLEVLDVSALGSCSRFWRELCGSDCLWESFTRERWPSVSFVNNSNSCSVPMGWREIYIRMHREMASKVATVVELVDQSETLEINHFNRAIQILWVNSPEFRDIQMFLFKPQMNVLLNLVGLYYCIFFLKVRAGNIMDALLSCRISERQVCVKWWKLGRWFFGFRMRDESHSRMVSLADLATDKGAEALGVLRRGAIHEVLLVEISISNATSTGLL